MAGPLRDRIFSAWAGVITRHPLAVLGVAGLLAAASIALMVTRWQFQSDRNQLISQELEWSRRYTQIQRRYPGAHDMIVVIDAGEGAAEPGSEAYRRARALADELGPALRASPLVEVAIWGAEFGERALRLAPLEQFRARFEQAAEAQTLLASPTPADLVARIALRMQAGRGATQPDPAALAEDLAELNHMLAAMGQVLAREPAEPVDFAALAAPPGLDASPWRYLASDNGRLLFIRVTPRPDPATLDPYEPALRSVRATVKQVVARHPRIDAGVTGIDVMEADETQVATWDSAWTSALAAMLITVLLVVAFHSFRTPLLAMIALLTGIAWTYGFIFLVIGHLQVLSVVFNLLLLGLGVAYGIYLAASFELRRHDYPDDLEGFRQTLADAMQIMGPGIFTGAITTAAAFATTIFTDFTGVAEMGMIAGVGIMLCLVAMFSVFPALLRLFKPDWAHIASMESRYVHFFEERWAMPFVRRPGATLAVAAALTAVALLAILDMKFDYDLLKLQPRKAPSVRWQRRIVREGKQSIWFALSEAASLGEARQRAEAFLRLPTVGGVGGVGLLFPQDEPAKVALLEQVRLKLDPVLDAALPSGDAPSATAPAATPVPVPVPAPGAAPGAGPGAAPGAGPGAGDLLAQLSFFRLMMRGAATAEVPPVLRTRIDELGRTLDSILNAAERLTPQERRARLDRLTRVYQQWRRDTAQRIARLTDPSPLRLEDLPAELMRSYQDPQGRLALEVYAKLPPGVAGPLDADFLPGFVRQLETVDPQVTGPIPQIYRSAALIKRSYQRAGLLALALVIAVVLFDFRSVHDALLILLPVGMAFAITFALMWLAGMTVNMANIIVLPLMFGIGVDSGVHVLNRYRQNPDEAPRGLTHGTGKGITITCLTSAIGFGAMMLSSHRGIASLGFVLSIGLLMTMLACWTVIPAWLELRSRRTPLATLPRAA